MSTDLLSEVVIRQELQAPGIRRIAGHDGLATGTVKGGGVELV